MAKFSDEEIIEIRISGESTEDLAKRYGISARCIRDIVAQRTYKKVKPVYTSTTSDASADASADASGEHEHKAGKGNPSPVLIDWSKPLDAAQIQVEIQRLLNFGVKHVAGQTRAKKQVDKPLMEAVSKLINGFSILQRARAGTLEENEVKEIKKLLDDIRQEQKEVY